jgi:competence protein ComEC
MAGFSVPTQRAFIMVTVFMLGIVLRRRVASLDILALAMLLVLLLDPLAVLSAGFWLSFIAVAVILLSLNGRIRPASRIIQWSAVQWVVSIGLLPLLVMLFGRVSLIAPLANLLAVPWVSFITVPLVMLSLPGLLFDNALVLVLAADSLQCLWFILEKMAALPFSAVYLHAAPYWSYLPAMIGIAWLLMPRGIPARWLGVVCLLPLLLIKPASPLEGEYVLNVLDVGQGLSVLVQTREHVLVFDTGARLSTQYDMGSAVILPALRQQAITRVDVLMISHGDNDHNGGTQAVLNGIPVKRVISGEPDDIPGEVEHCYAGQSWEWDGVRFEVLYPERGSAPASKTNNRSCVLRIANGNHAVLLTGDIEAIVEHSLLNSARDKLQSSILLAPHHGSKSSSSEDFIAAVKPKHVVFSTGYRNHYHFPRELIQQRYRRIGSQMYQTDQTGMLSLSVPRTGQLVISGWRDAHRRYWHTE